MNIYSLCVGIAVLARISVCAVSSELYDGYIQRATEYSDIHEHLPHLAYLAQDCESVLELGLRDMISSWGLLYGLAHNQLPNKKYTGVDLESPIDFVLQPIQKVALANHITLNTHYMNDLKFPPIEVDMLFIDTLHTYCQLTCELEHFSPKVRKYIVMHDTSDPWGDEDDRGYRGNYAEYPAHINKTKRGLWTAVEDFLATHPEWTLKARYTNNHGLTILQRKK